MEGEGRIRLELFTEESLLRLENKRRNAAKEYGGSFPKRRSKAPEWEELVQPPYPAALYGRPVAEVDHYSLDRVFCVITRRFSKYYLYRFSANKALCLFSPWSPLRVRAIQIATHRFFDYFVITTILVNCVFLALSSPPEETEYVFLSIYTIEMVIKCIARGFILNRYTYLRNFWNWLDFIVITCGYLTLCIPAENLDMGNLAGLRTFRVLRALKTVSILPGLKTIVNAMLHSIKMLAEVMALTIFCLMVFALLALQLYMGNLRHSCVGRQDTNSTNNSIVLLLEDGVPFLCGNATGARSCPKYYSCLPNAAPNPNYGYTNFDSYGWAILNCLQLITLDFWEDIYEKVLVVSGPASIFFFLLVIFLGSFYIVNLTLAVVAICYQEEAMNAIKEKDRVLNREATPRMSSIFGKKGEKPSALEHRRIRASVGNQTANLSDSDDHQEAGSSGHQRTCHRARNVAPDIVISTHFVDVVEEVMSSAEDSDIDSPYKTYKQRKKRLSAKSNRLLQEICGTSGANESVQQLPQIRNCWEDGPRDESDVDPANAKLSARFQACRHAGQNVCSWTRKLLKVVVEDPIFDLLITSCILVNTVFLAVEHHGMSPDTQKALVHGNLVFTVIFTLEALMKLIALGKLYFLSKWNIFDLTVVAVSLMDLGLETVNGLSVLRTFRLLRVLKLAQSWPTMRMLLGIIGTTLGAVGNMTLVLAVIVYIFAVLGMQLFAHAYTEDRFLREDVPRWNFNDFPHSLLVIFRVLCGEWVEPLWDCLRGAPDKNHLCFAVFLSALTVGNFLVLNLFLAMLLNSFNSRDLTEIDKDKSSDSKVMAGFRKLKLVISRRQTMDENPNDKAETRVEEEELESEERSESSPKPPEQPKMAWEDMPAEIQSSPEIHRAHQAMEMATLVRQAMSACQKESEKRSLETLKKFANSPIDSTKQEPEDCFPDVIYAKCPDFEPAEWFKWMRRMSFRIVEHKVFEWVILLLIFSSSFLLCFEDIHLAERPQRQLALNILNNIFTVCFIMEMLLKWFGHGFVVYFTSIWTLMDFIIVNVSVLSIVLESSGGGGLFSLRAIRTLRALRPLRAVSRWQGMRIVVNALLSAIPAIFNVLLVCVLFWLIFSIMGVQFFGGRFFKCVDQEGNVLSAQIVNNRTQCLELNHTWENSKINFDNVGNAYLALFQVATFEGWLEIMADASDSREVDEQPSFEANMVSTIYFVVFIICGSFFTLNLFIGVIIDNFNMLKKKYEGGILEMFLTESQKTYYTAMQKLGRKKPQRIISRPKNVFQAFCYDTAISRRFEITIFALILLNMVAMSCEHYEEPELMNSILVGLNIVFTTIFSLEVAIKIVGLRHHYFTVPWNIFDLTVVITSIIGVIFEEVLQTFVISPTLLRVIRLVRIGRVLRLVKAAKGIRKLLFALIISLPALFNIGALLFLVTFIYAIIGMSLFGHVKHSGALTETVNFETFENSMLLLFRLCTAAGWNDVLDPLLVSPPDCDLDYKNIPNGNCGNAFSAIFFLVSFIIINYMVIINMYIAIILENLNQASQEEEMGITEDDIESFYAFWARYDPHATQFIHFEQLSDFVASLDPPLVIPKPNMLALVSLNLPICEGNNIHCLDVLHGLTKLVLGDVEETEEFKKIRDQIDQRFLKSFPSRNQVEVVSTSLEWKLREKAAVTIQRAFREYLNSQSTQL